MKIKSILWILALAVIIGFSSMSMGQGMAAWGYTIAQQVLGLVVRVWIRTWLVFNYVGKTWMRDYGLVFAQNYYGEILTNPDPASSGILNLTGFFIHIIQPLYIVAIMGVAFYLIFVSTSPGGRSKAKSMLGKLALSMIVVSLSPVLMQILLSISYSLTKTVLDLIPKQEVTKVLTDGMWIAFGMFAFIAPANADFSIPYQMTIFIMAFIPHVVLSLRFLLLIMFMIFLPLSLFFYSIPLLRGIGRKLLEQTLVWTFMQFFFALAIVTFILLGSGLEENFINPTIDPGSVKAWVRGISIGGMTIAATAIGSMFGGWGALIGLAAGAIIGGVVHVILVEFLMFSGVPLGPFGILDFLVSVAIYITITTLPLLMTRWVSNFLP